MRAPIGSVLVHDPGWHGVVNLDWKGYILLGHDDREAKAVEAYENKELDRLRRINQRMQQRLFGAQR